jgi:hypothetical protein
MTCYDVFNGDADGICSLHQLRLAAPAESVLVTGVKRDIALLARVPAFAGDVVTVLDLSADVNHAALVALLERGARVEYFDHHVVATALPRHPNLRAHLDPSAQTCTGLLVDRHLGGLHRPWAVVAAYGDNIAEAAHAAARPLDLAAEQERQLRELGELIAYNAYGDTEADLVVHPAELYRALAPYRDPFAFIEQAPVCRLLAERKCSDVEATRRLQPELALPGASIYILPDAPWARRVRGLLANDLANRHAHLANAVLTPNRAGGYTVSVRAPAARPDGADALCRQFPTGGGRVGAAGINHLPRSELPRFVQAMDAAFRRPATALGPAIGPSGRT